MLHILFLILKVILIILLSILGVIVLLALVILFVPIRYKIWFRKDDDIQARITVSWLLRIVFVKAYYLDQKFRAIIRIFGYPVYDTLKPKKEKKVKKAKQKENKVKPRENKVESSVPEEKQPKSRTIEIPQNDAKEVVISKPAKEQPKIEIKDALEEPAKEQPKIEIKEVLEEPAKEQPQQTQDCQENVSEDEPTEDMFDKIEGFFGKIADAIKGVFHKIGAVGQKIKNTCSKIKEKVSNLITKIKGISGKKDKLLAFWHVDTNRQGITKAFVSLAQILKEIGPEKIEGKIVFGTGDPCSTGQALGAAAFFYGMYGQSIQITPDFENSIFQADVTIKGRIRIIRLLIIGIRLIRDKNFSRLLKNVKQLKEEL